MFTFLNKQKSSLANIISGNPSERMRVIGITGTRGKTVVTHMLHHILRELGVKPGFISSYGYTLDNENVYADKTANNLKPGEAHALISKMAKNGINFALIEMTSQNLKNKNYEGIILDSGIITNIFEDSLPRYKNVEEYAKTKLDFINHIRDEGFLVIHKHNPTITNWLADSGNDVKNNIYTHWTEDNNAKNIENYIDSISFDLDSERYSLPIVSNLSNAIQAIRLAQAYFPKKNVKKAFESIKTLPGRMQVFQTEPFVIIIDHSNNAAMLENSLLYLNAIKQKESRIITIFGASGEVDKEKRAMGIPAAKYSTLVVLGANDSKGEKVYDINSEIEAKAQPYHGIFVERLISTEEYQLVNKNNLKMKIDRVIQNGDIPFVSFDADDYTSRLDAIDFTVKFARPGDIVYIAGKGAEDSLKFSKVEYEWSDEEAVKKVLGRS